MIRYTIFLLLALLPLHAFEDDDIDGVENTQDLCPNSSFDDIVNEDGCAENENYWGTLTFILETDFNVDETTTTDYTFFSNYQYNQWDFSLYNSEQTSLDNNNNERESAGDLYLSTGYRMQQENLYGKLTLGVKLPTGESEVSTEETDYFCNLSMSYALNEKVALLSSLSYTLTGDSNETTYNNPLGYSLGLGYMVNENWYTSLSYQESNSIYEDGEDYQSVSLFNSYNFTDNFFGTLNYTKGIDELSYDQTISLRLGVTFE